ncbi:MAG: phosphatase PAP2 family protein [Xanthobacteraceae bacterium]|nr:phosphatase PAP2 family protein [Xanthobacteraceae bacterium]
MSTGTEAGTPSGAVASRLRRPLANLRLWLAALVRPPRRLRPRRLRALGMRFALGTLLALAAIAATMLLVDGPASAATRRLPYPLIDAFNEFTDFGRSGWFLIPLAVLIGLSAMVSSPALGRIGQLVLASLVVRLGYVFLAIALPGLVVTVAKRLIGRVRPSELGHFAFFPWSWQPSYASLPSGHATTAFAAAMAIALLWPRARIPIFVFAIGIALSRVVISAHYPSDVLAGAFVGCFAAVLVRDWFAARNLGFVVGPQGQVTALPGPSLRRVKSVAGRVFGQ